MRIVILGTPLDELRHYQRILSAFSEVELVPFVEGIPQPVDAGIVHAGIQRRPRAIAQALELTKHILCDVPFASTLAEAENVIQRCDLQGIKLYPALRLRYLPVFKSLKTMIEQNTLGNILSLKVQHRARKLGTVSSPGRDLMLPTMLQVIDLVCWLTGLEFTGVHAEFGVGLHHADQAVEDGAILSAALPNGAYALLDFSLSLPHSYPAPEDLELEVIGTGGWVRIDAYCQTIHTYFAQGETKANWGSDPTRELLEAFLDAINRDVLTASARDALRAQKIALSVFESLETL